MTRAMPALTLAFILSVLLAAAPTIAAGERPPTVRPFADDGPVAARTSSPGIADKRGVAGDPLTAGADHILAQQCLNGGFGWPHDTCATTSTNITAPILLGVLDVLDAHGVAGDPAYLLAAEAGGDHDLGSQFDNGEARFATLTPSFLERLSAASSNPAYASFAATELFAALAAGTYGPDDRDTAEWITIIQDGRTGLYVNLRPWEFHLLAPAATTLGQPGQTDLFVQAILDGLGTLDASDPATASHDLIGLAGAVRGLALTGVTLFPAISAPLHSDVDGLASLEGLASLLASYQNFDGSWNWHSNLAAPGITDGDVQTTAYAVLALQAADPLTLADHRQAAARGRDWMLTLQQADGGIPEYPRGPENTEVEGEFLSAVVAVGDLLFLDGFETGASSYWSESIP